MENVEAKDQKGVTTPTLADRLVVFAEKGVTFYDAKQQLMSEGYIEAEISIVVASNPYGKPPKGEENERNPLAGVDAETLHAVGRELADLERARSVRSEQANIIMMAATRRHPLGAFNSLGVKALFDVTEDVGFPLLWLLGGGILATLIIVGVCNTPGIMTEDTANTVQGVAVNFLRIYVIIVNGLFIRLVVRRHIGHFKIEDKLSQERGYGRASVLPLIVTIGVFLSFFI